MLLIKMKNYGLFLLTIYFDVLLQVCSQSLISSQCESARTIYNNAGFTTDDIYSTEQSENLKVCHPSRTCCKEKAESNLVNISENQRKKLTSPQHEKIRKAFHDSGGQFRGMFRKMIQVSQGDLDKMFEKTYGPRYANNTQVFKKLYISLNQYLNGSELLLTDKVDDFFGELHKKIYIMTRPLSLFTKKYENCIYENTNYARPFGDTQRKIAHETSRSFMASRVFLEGLKEGMDVVTDLLNLPVQDECSIAFMKMTQCSICSGVSSDIVKPCMNYCKNVMKGCFAYIIMIQSKWDEYISGMVSLAEKLEGPFSMEAVVGPLGVKISEAIMTFQDNLGNITVKIEEKCGKPPVRTLFSMNNRNRRSLSSKTEDLLKKVSESENLLNKFKSDTQKIINGINSESSTSLTYLYQKRKKASDFEQLVGETKTYLNGLKDFWIKLPHELCTNGLATEDIDQCWNGHNTSRYIHKVVGDSREELFNKNPEVSLNHGVPLVIIRQYRKLEAMVKRLAIALTGETSPNIIDNEVGSGESGDGKNEGNEVDSGDGSGDPEGSGTGGESGTGPIDTTTTTTQSTIDKCLNSVDEDCYEEIRSTKSPNEIENNNVLPIVEEVNDDNRNSACLKNMDFMILSICVLFTYYIL